MTRTRSTLPFIVVLLSIVSLILFLRHEINFGNLNVLKSRSDFHFILSSLLVPKFYNGNFTNTNTNILSLDVILRLNNSNDFDPDIHWNRQSVILTTQGQLIPTHSLEVQSNQLSKSSPSIRIIKTTKSSQLPLETVTEKLRNLMKPQKEAFKTISTTSCECHSNITNRLNSPILTDEDMKWCQWALDPKGGRVIVGSSWGILKHDGQKKYDRLNCNSILNGINPSCNDLWGDIHVKNWSNYHSIHKASLCKLSNTKSNITCYYNENKERYCIMNQVQIDFHHMETITSRSGPPHSRKFDSQFLTINCDPIGTKTDKSHFPFPHLYSREQINHKPCDQQIHGTTLLYTHDEIRNLAHTIQDLMNVFLMIWLDRDHQSSIRLNDITFLNIDALKLKYNFDDKLVPFFNIYKRNFKRLLQGIQFQKQVICFDRMIIQTVPSKGFVWENWQQDATCSFHGPSSLFQRYNIFVRHSYGLLHSLPSNTKNHLITNNEISIVLILRNETMNPWGSMRSSRIIKNPNDLIKQINLIVNRGKSFFTSDSNSNFYKPSDIKFHVIDMASLDFDRQIHLMSQTSILIGVHGAGISHLVHMPIGTRFCCSIIEIYPTGEFSVSRGFGNMARRMGIEHNRIDVNKKNSLQDGVIIPYETVGNILEKILNRMASSSLTCLLPDVLNDPYLIS